MSRAGRNFLLPRPSAGAIDKSLMKWKKSPNNPETRRKQDCSQPLAPAGEPTEQPGLSPAKAEKSGRRFAGRLTAALERLNPGAWFWPGRFFLLALVTALCSLALHFAHIPAALLLGPMLAAILLSLAEIHLKIGTRLFTAAQGIIGCMIGGTITPDILHEMAADWPIFIGGVVSVIIAAAFIGYILAKKQLLPGTTAIWGSAPGGASVMVFMAEADGADVRLVAVMQYLRVVLVALTGALLAHFVAPAPAPAAPAAAAAAVFPPFAPLGLLITLLVAFGGGLGARFILRLPAGGLLGPFFITVLLQNTGLFSPVLPPWLLALFYMIIGWNIGLRFTRAIVLHALALMPVLLLSTFSLMALCGLFAVILSYIGHVDLLTAYLATSPGGADSVSIIAASTVVNMPFVMSYQSVRLLLVTLTGPFTAGAIAKYLNATKRKQKQP